MGLKGRPGVVARSLDRAAPATEGLLQATRCRMVLRLGGLRSQAVAGARDPATTEFERLPAGRKMALARLLAKPPRRKQEKESAGSEGRPALAGAGPASAATSIETRWPTTSWPCLRSLAELWSPNPSLENPAGADPFPRNLNARSQ